MELVKLMKKALVGGTVLSVLVVGVVLVGAHFAEKAKESRDAKVLVSVKFDPHNCGAATPMQVVIHNSGEETVDYINWTYDVYLASHSERRGVYSDSTDRIISPGNTIALCSSLIGYSNESKRLEHFDGFQLEFRAPSKSWRHKDIHYVGRGCRGFECD